MRAEYSNKQESMVVDLDESEVKHLIGEALHANGVVLGEKWKIRLDLPYLTTLPESRFKNNLAISRMRIEIE